MIRAINLVADLLLLPDDILFAIDPLHNLELLPMALIAVVANGLIIFIVAVASIAIAAEIDVEVRLGLGCGCTDSEG